MATLDKTDFSQQEAWGLLAEKMVTRKVSSLKMGFWDFIRDVWSKGYTRPELFNAWHVGQLCEDVEEAMSRNLWYLAILPRFHLKSTVLGHGFSVWRHLSMPSDSDILYLSYSDGMSQRHIQEINKAVRRNEVLSDLLKDRSPQADYSFRYFSKDNRAIETLHGGLFSFKRGLHVNGGMIADDILRDPDNPLNLTQLTKVEDHFLTETIFIPSRESPVIVLGTPMAPNDLLSKLRSDERFMCRMLPALDPEPGRRVLFPLMFSEEDLLSHQRARPKSFSSEFMLNPYLSEDSYFSIDDIKSVEDPQLATLDPYRKHEIDSDFTVAGFDVGKKRHPSHLSVFGSKNGELFQICSFFMDGWEYVRQVDFLNMVIDSFGIDRGYIDNTRGELEERGLLPEWLMLSFTQKNKRTQAQILEQYISGLKIRLIIDERQRSQITSVNNELDAPETPLGHGDAFFSNGLATLAYHEKQLGGTEDLGDMQDFAGAISGRVEQPLGENLSDSLRRIHSFPQDNSEQDKSGCPQCGEVRSWIKENRLCLACMLKFPVGD